MLCTEEMAFRFTPTNVLVQGELVAEMSIDLLQIDLHNLGVDSVYFAGPEPHVEIDLNTVSDPLRYKTDGRCTLTITRSGGVELLVQSSDPRQLQDVVRVGYDRIEHLKDVLALHGAQAFLHTAKFVWRIGDVDTDVPYHINIGAFADAHADNCVEVGHGTREVRWYPNGKPDVRDGGFEAGTYFYFGERGITLGLYGDADEKQMLARMGVDTAPYLMA